MSSCAGVPNLPGIMFVVVAGLPSFRVAAYEYVILVLVGTMSVVVTLNASTNMLLLDTSSITDEMLFAFK